MTKEVLFIVIGAILIVAMAVAIRKLLLIQIEISETPRPSSDELLRIYLHIKDAHKGIPRKQLQLLVEWEKDVREQIQIEDKSKNIIHFKRRRCSEAKVVNMS